jgi:hypothetical protein
VGSFTFQGLVVNMSGVLFVAAIIVGVVSLTVIAFGVAIARLIVDIYKHFTRGE